MSSVPDTLTCALWLAGRDIHVFAVDHPSLPRCVGAHRPDQPCDGKRGKHPCGKWSRDATTDPDAIQRMFAKGARNIGAACGSSNLLVIDEDEPDALTRYAESVGVIVEPTFSVLTSRGAHRYYRQPDGAQLGNSPGALAAFHNDVRGRGGFVVTAGSTHEAGHIYRPVDSAAPILSAPEWLLTALRPVPTAPRRPPLRAPRPSKAMEGLVHAVLTAGAGNRNQCLYWASRRAFEQVNSGLFTHHYAAQSLLDAAIGAGLPENEAKATIISARRATGTRTT